MQKERLTVYVKAQGWELYKVYEDKGFSGKNTARPAFQAMMQDAEAERFNVLVVYKIDRLSRSILDFHTTIEKLKKHNISFVSVTQQFDTTTSTGRLMLAILVDFANFEREIDVDRAIDAFKARLSKGLPSGSIPYGYKRVKGNKVVIVPEEAEKVKEIYDLAIKNHSIAEISRRTGFSIYHVRSILRQPFYCGYLVRRRDGKNKRIPESDWEWYKGQHEPIISLETYKQAANVRKSRAKVTKTSYSKLFSHLIYCPYCEHNLSFHTRHNKRGDVSFYYICERVSPSKGGCAQYVNEEKMEMILLRTITRIVKVKSVKDKKENNIIEQQVKQLDKKIERLVALSERVGNVQEIAKRINELKEKRNRLIKAPQKKTAEINIAELKNTIKNIATVYPYMNREEKAYFWHLAIKRIVAYKSEFLIEWNGLGTTRVSRRIVYKKRIKSGGGGGDRTIYKIHMEKLAAILGKVG